MTLAVKGARIFYAVIADGRPSAETAAVTIEGAIVIQHILIDHDIGSQFCIGRGIAFVDMGSKPVQLAGIVNLIIAVRILLGRLILLADAADAIDICALAAGRFSRCECIDCHNACYEHNKRQTQ